MTSNSFLCMYDIHVYTDYGIIIIRSSAMQL